jgi:hypothetical protein
MSNIFFLQILSTQRQKLPFLIIYNYPLYPMYLYSNVEIYTDYLPITICPEII